MKKLLRTASVGQQSSHSQQVVTQQASTEEPSGPTTWLNKQRVKLNYKLLGHQTSVMKEDKPTYREQFVPPDTSMLAFLLKKVNNENVIRSNYFLHFLFVNLSRTLAN